MTHLVALPLAEDEALQMLAPAKSPKTDSGDRFDLGAVVRAGSPFKVTANGVPVGAYVVQGFGDVLWATAAAGSAAFDLIAVMNQFVHVQAKAAGFTELAIRTERRGLVRKAKRLGWKVTRQDGAQYFLRKSIQ